jgi:hypothetical protein
MALRLAQQRADPGQLGERFIGHGIINISPERDNPNWDHP